MKTFLKRDLPRYSHRKVFCSVTFTEAKKVFHPQFRLFPCTASLARRTVKALKPNTSKEFLKCLDHQFGFCVLNNLLNFYIGHLMDYEFLVKIFIVGFTSHPISGGGVDRRASCSHALGSEFEPCSVFKYCFFTSMALWC